MDASLLLTPILTYPLTLLRTRLTTYTLYSTLPLRPLLQTHLTRHTLPELYAGLPYSLAHTLLRASLKRNSPFSSNSGIDVLLRVLISPLRTRAVMHQLNLGRVGWGWMEAVAGVLLVGSEVVLERVGWEGGVVEMLGKGLVVRALARALVGRWAGAWTDGVVVWGEGRFWKEGVGRVLGVGMCENAVGYLVRACCAGWYMEGNM